MKIGVIDLETTHIDHRRGSICEIGIALLNLDNGEIERIFDKVCKEDGIEIDPKAWIFYNSTLTYTDVINSEPFESYREELQNIFNTYHMTSYSNFDFKWLINRGFTIPNRFFDPMIKLTPIMKLPYSMYKYKYPSVEEAYEFLFKENLNEEHRAIDDAEVEAKIIYEIYTRLEREYEDI